MCENQECRLNERKPGNRFIVRKQLGSVNPGVYEFDKTKSAVIAFHEIYENEVSSTDVDTMADTHFNFGLRHRLISIFEPYTL